MQNSITKALVLLITSNRPDYTIQVFEKTKKAKIENSILPMIVFFIHLMSLLFIKNIIKKDNQYAEKY
jgi:hypothetical protein